MKAYISPTYGNDTTGRLDDRSHPFQSHDGAQAYIDELVIKQQLRKGTPVLFVETHRPPPVSPPEPPLPPLSPVEASGE